MTSNKITSGSIDSAVVIASFPEFTAVTLSPRSSRSKERCVLSVAESSAIRTFFIDEFNNLEFSILGEQYIE
jgi:hypothetical protein